VVVPKQQSINYTIFQSLLEKSLESPKVESLCKDKVAELLFLAESEAEKERLRCVIVKASSLSTTQARKIYGFHDMDKRIKNMNEAAAEAQSIKECVEKMCRIKDKALLRSFGVDSEGSSSESDSESESDSDTQGEKCADMNKTLLSCAPEQSLSVLSPQQCLDLLRLCNLNWFEFVKRVQDMFNGTETDAIEDVLSNFKENLSSFDISLEDERIIDQSHKAYIQSNDLQTKQRNIDEGMIVSDSESSEDEGNVWTPGEELLGEKGRALLMKKRSAVKRKAVREIMKKVAEKDFLKDVAAKGPQEF
jgi:hypothetical protein